MSTGATTVKVAVTSTSGEHEPVAVHVIVAVPPQADGAAAELFVTDKLHPPLEVTVATHALKAASI